MPEFESGYYKSLIKDPKTTTMNGMKIRDSNLIFRTSSQGSSMEGLKIDRLALDIIFVLVNSNVNWKISPKRAYRNKVVREAKPYL